MSFCSSIKQTNEMKHFPLRMRSSIASLLVHILNRLLQVTLLHTLASWPASYILMQLICMLVYKWCDFICSAVKVTWPAETRNQRASFCAILLAQCSGSKTIDNTSHWQWSVSDQQLEFFQGLGGLETIRSHNEHLCCTGQVEFKAA